MKTKLKEKYFLPTYWDCLLEQLNDLHQGTISVQEYMTKYDVMLVISELKEDPRYILVRFRSGLRADIRREMDFTRYRKCSVSFPLSPMLRTNEKLLQIESAPLKPERHLSSSMTTLLDLTLLLLRNWEAHHDDAYVVRDVTMSWETAIREIYS